MGVNLTEQHRQLLAQYEDFGFSLFNTINKFPQKEQLKLLRAIAEVVSVKIRDIHEHPKSE